MVYKDNLTFNTNFMLKAQFGKNQISLNDHDLKA